MYKMQKTSENELIEDLYITGAHGILVDDLENYKEENEEKLGSTIMIDDKYILLSCLSNKFVKVEESKMFTYYHFSLENNGNNDERYGVWANGLLVENQSVNQWISVYKK
jgi:hypothetical protein